MPPPLLTTKLYRPRPRPSLVPRPRLLERLSAGLHGKLTLISAPAGFGKTTLLSEWANQRDEGGVMKAETGETLHPSSFIPHPSPFIPHPSRVAWLSLDERDNDPARFLAYLVAALRTLALGEVDGVMANVGAGVLNALQAPQPPPIESILTALLNEITTIPNKFVVVLDDYHMIDTGLVDQALTFLLNHLPPQMHMIIATREDPSLPLARLRVRGQLNELRVTDLRFTLSEAAEFLNQVMGLNLSAEDIAMLETRTEGWIAGLQMAAISMQGRADTASFIKSFTGSHHFVLDYLVEEVLQQQPESVQAFLLHTSILDRLCGPLCDSVLRASSASGQETLEYLQHTNLFIVPLDNERRWYRYHHLFAGFLRQRLHKRMDSTGDEGRGVAELHIRASGWYEGNGQELEAFHHAVAANDVGRAARLMEGGGMPGTKMPLHFRGAVAPVLNWLASLPETVLDARPSLWVMYASALSMTGQTTGVEQKLQAAESAIAEQLTLQDAEPDAETRNLIGHIAAIRALLAAIQHQIEAIITQSHRALEYLHPDNLPVRTATIWKLGIAYQLQGDRAAARQAYTEAISISQASGNAIINMSATIGLAQIQEAENQLYLAAETYRRVLQLAGDPPQPAACEAHLGLARICCEWNDLEAAEWHGKQSVQLARQIEGTDSFVVCEMFLARLTLARGDASGAAAMLAKADQFVRQHNFLHRMPEVAAAQALVLLHQGNLAVAAQLVEKHELPVSQARVYLAQGDAGAALAALGPVRQQMEAKGWADERLKVMALQVVALRAHGEKAEAVQLLGDALTLAEPGGFIRIFVDEGPPMAELLTMMGDEGGRMTEYIRKLLASFGTQKDVHPFNPDRDKSSPSAKQGASSQPLVDPLSPRELEVLQLVAQGLSNREISERLFLSLNTVKGHNRKIFGKLQVKRRTEAVARARELGLV